jgi:hypothetical protein
MAETQQPSGTVTLVFTDIEGSTRLLHSLGAEGYRSALGEHQRVVRAAFDQQDGYEVDTAGDGFFYAFSTAAGAAHAVGEALAALDGGPVRVRAGIHTGEPITEASKQLDAIQRALMAEAGIVYEPVMLEQLEPVLSLARGQLGAERVTALEGAVGAPTMERALELLDASRYTGSAA